MPIPFTPPLIKWCTAANLAIIEASGTQSLPSSPYAVSYVCEPQNIDLDGYELTATVISPSNVDVSSEKVDEDDLSDIDGYSSASSGFDMAVALEGDSAFVEVDLTVREIE